MALLLITGQGKFLQIILYKFKQSTLWSIFSCVLIRSKTIKIPLLCENEFSFATHLSPLLCLITAII